MKRFLALIWLLSFYNFSCFCQSKDKEAKNYVGLSCVTGSNDPDAYEFSYERTIDLLQVKTCLKFSIIPHYQYSEFLPGFGSVYKNYFKQNLVILEAIPYLYIGKRREQSKGFFFRAGTSIIPFHLKYDTEVIPGISSSTVHKEVNKYILDLGVSGGAGYQFGLFGSEKRVRIEAGGRISLRMNEPGVLMFKISGGFCF